MSADATTGILQPRKAILRMAPYKPPAEGRAGKLRLDFNENTVGCSSKVLAYLKEHLDRETLAVYPEYSATRAALARFFEIEEPQLVMTNGTDEAIQVLVNTYVDDGDDVLVLHPSYAMYRFYSEVAGAAVRELSYREEDLAFPLEELLEAIRPETKAILIANPNNPTGTGVEVDSLRRIMERAPRAAILIDEAYYEFSGVTAIDCIKQYPNVFISRTFSKVFGMAAMRVGCILTRAENAAFLRKGQSPYSVNLLGAIAVRAAIEDTQYVMTYVAEVILARDLVYDGLSRLDIPFYRSMANFVLFRAGDRAIEIRDKLRERGILVRDRSYEIPGCVRVTIGRQDQARRFLEELERIW